MAFRYSILIGIAVVLLTCACGTGHNTRKLLEQGNAYMARGDYDKAASVFHKVIAADPRNAQAYYRLGLISWDTGRPGLEGYLRRAIDLDPNNHDALAKLGELYLLSYQRHDDPKWRPRYLTEIQDFASRLLALDRDGYDGLRLKGYAELYSGNLSVAADDFESALRKDPKARSAPAVAGDLVRALTSQGHVARADAFARDYMAAHPDAGPVYEALSSYYETHGNIDRAVELLTERSASNTAGIDAPLSLAALYLRLGRAADARRLLEQVSSDAARYPRGALRAAAFWAQHGNWDLAVHSYEKAAAQNPSKSGEIRLKIASLLGKQHRYAEALNVIESLDSNVRATPDALVQRMSILAAMGFPGGSDTAIGQLLALRQSMPRDARILTLLGRAYQAKGWLDKAGEALQSAAFLDQNSLEAQIALARLYQAQGNIAQMRDAAMAAVLISPDDVDAKLIRGITGVESGESGEARQNLKQVLDILPGEPEAEYYLARLNLNEGREKEAEAGFVQAAGHGYLRAIVALAELYQKNGDIARARQTVRAALDRDGSSLELKKALARLDLASGDFEQAAALLTALAAASPADADVRVNLVRAYLGMQDQAHALDAARQAERAGVKAPSLLMLLGDLYAETGKPQDAMRIYSRLVQSAPDNAVAGARLASLMLQTGGDPLQAQGIAEAAMRATPTNPEVVDTLGRIYVRRGLYDQAEPLYRSTLDRSPDNVQLRIGYADALFHHGMRTRARQELEQALRTHPPKDQVAVILAQLDRY